MHRADYETATARLHASLPLLRESDEDGRSLVSQVHTFLGTIPLLRGDHAQAAPLFEQALAMARQRGDRFGSYIALFNLALVAEARGDYDLAAGRLEEGVRLSEEMRERANLAYFLEGLAVVATARGETERSAYLFGAAEGLLETVGAPVYNYYQPDRSRYERIMAGIRSALGEPAFAAAWERGRLMTFDQAVAYALTGDEARPAASRPAGPASRPGRSRRTV